VAAVDRRPPQGEHHHGSRRERARPVDQEERPERDRREEAAERGSDAHAEVDREPREREGGLPLGWRHEVGDHGEARRTERLRGERERERHRDDGGVGAREREEEEDDAAREERVTNDDHRAEDVGETARERRRDESTEPVDEEDRARLAGREAEVPRQVEDEEGEDHRPRAVDERCREQDPHPTRHSLEVPPGFHWVIVAAKKCAALSSGAHGTGGTEVAAPGSSRWDYLWITMLPPPRTVVSETSGSSDEPGRLS
jgi:hypothetical protein